MLVWEVGSGVASHILILLNFMNIAKRRSFSATSQARDVQHVMAIGRNKRPVERTVVVLRRTVAHCSGNIASLIRKVNLPMRVFQWRLYVGGNGGKASPKFTS